MAKTLPQDAFLFRATPATIQTSKGDGTSVRKFTGIPYSGKPIRHSYWGVVAFDLSATDAPDPTPVLVEHDRDKRAGFATLDITDTHIQISDGTLLNNADGEAVASESDAGFPWQMSIHIQPGSIEEIAAGETIAVNGNTIHGPASIWRNNLIREVSFTPTGVDSETSAAALSGGATPPINPDNEETRMELEELKQEVADLKASLADEKTAREAAEQKATDATAALDAKNRETRLSAVKDMFKDLGRDFSEDAAKPYMDMTTDVFSAVVADMKAAKPQPSNTLFSSQADNGQNPEEGGGAALMAAAEANSVKS